MEVEGILAIRGYIQLDEVANPMKICIVSNLTPIFVNMNTNKLKFNIWILYFVQGILCLVNL